jgi:nitroimidazol reductase NimA-like FMN-containing flavoprotein (pyridoxamine 5'-phosphate oxidase superfamily)
VEVDRNGLEVLDEDECLRLLSHASVGRVSVSVGALPAIFPVNYCVRNGAVLFRTGKGTKLDAAAANSVVAFEVDDFDPVEHTGWSVMLVGIARDATDELDRAALDVSTIPRWATSADGRVVAIVPEQVTGRRLRHDLDG